MNRKEALELLGLGNAVTPLTPDIVQTAFRKAMVEHHPDKAADVVLKPYDNAPRTIFNVGVYQEARKVLLENLTDADSACKLCQGVKMVRGKFGWRTCSACHGTGVRQ